MKYGQVAEVETPNSISDKITVMYLAPTALAIKHGLSIADAIILSGACVFDGVVREPGYIGPLDSTGDHVRWLDDTSP